jgi:hypothetical protein
VAWEISNEIREGKDILETQNTDQTKHNCAALEELVMKILSSYGIRIFVNCVLCVYYTTSLSITQTTQSRKVQCVGPNICKFILLMYFKHNGMTYAKKGRMVNGQ